MSVLILILLTGLLESKVQTRSPKVHWRHFAQSCSQHNSKRDTASLLVLHQKVKMELLRPRILLQMNEKEMLTLCRNVMLFTYLLLRILKIKMIHGVFQLLLEAGIVLL